MSLTRKYFIQGLSSATALAAMGGSLLVSRKGFAAEGTDGVQWKLTGSHWGAFKAKVVNGKVEDIVPFEIDTNPTDMLNGIKGIIYSPSRIRYPMVRLGWLKKSPDAAETRGDNRFVRVSWDKANELFYNELERVQKNYGPWALHAGQTGWRQTGQFQTCTSHMQRAVALHGNFIKKSGDYSTGAGQVILPYVLGSTEVYSQGTSWSEILEHSDNIVLWSIDLVKNLQVGWNCATHQSYPFLAQLQEKVKSGKINVISVDPVETHTQRYLGCKHQYINPQTDVAFMLAVAQTLIAEDLYDKDFIDIYCQDFEPFSDYVMGKAEDKTVKTPEWAQPICGIEPEKIREFARMLMKGRTQLLVGWSIQRQQHGEQPYWMLAVLAAMIGKIGLPGGGVSYGHHYSGIGVPSTGLAAPGSFPRNLDPGEKPVWDNDNFNGYSPVIPVARWIDSILEPGKKIQFNGTEVILPEIKMMVFSGCNPWHHQQQKNRMKEAFRKLETVVTIDFTWNATCRFSDIVLPACTQWERNDIDLYGSYSQRGILAMHKVIEPLFESKNDFQIFSDFTKLYGRNKEYTRGMNEEQWIKMLYEGARAENAGKFDLPEFDVFWKEGFFDAGLGKPWVRHAEFREDPELHALGTPSGLIEISSRKIGRYGYKHCQSYPMWFEKEERSHGGPGSDKFPFWLQSCHPNKRLHSQMCDSTEFRETYTVKGREPIYINPEDAKKKGIVDGDLVRVYNDRGQLIAGAVLSTKFPPGVVRIYEGAWYAPVDAAIGSIDTYGDPNTLTIDIGTSELAQAVSANTCIVEFEKFVGEPPKVTAFGGPTEVKA